MATEMKERVDAARLKFEELHDMSLSGIVTSAQASEAYWLDREIQLIQAEALVRLAYKAWM